jgi:hypothetical protein
MEFGVCLPLVSPGFRLPGVYRISFGDGFYYIGCSIDLWGRSESWRHEIKNTKALATTRVSAAMADKIRASDFAQMDVVELCASEEVKDREAFYLNKYKSDRLMLSVSECQFKPVLQYKKDGVFVKRHISITAAAKYNNTTLWRIQEVLNGNRLSHKEMVFVYESDYEIRRRNIEKQRYTFDLPRKSKDVKVIQQDMNGAVLATYDTYVMAARRVGCKEINIKRAIAGRQQTAAGFKWALS